MIIYNPNDENIIKERIEEAQNILGSIPAKYCFISGSFLFKKEYKDIDVFVISRTKKEINCINKKINIIRIDFNDLHSLFYHSASKSCIAKNILPKKPLKVTIADYWGVINEAVPTILNEKNKYHKNIRFLILYTEYFKNKKILDMSEIANTSTRSGALSKGKLAISEHAQEHAPGFSPAVLDTYELRRKIERFKNFREILDYIKREAPLIIHNHTKKSYIKRYFYTQAGYYKELTSYQSQKYLYELSHSVVKGAA